MLKNQFANSISIPALKVAIGGSLFLAESKRFSTKSVGWYLNGKTVCTAGRSITVNVNGSSFIAEYKDFSTGSWGWHLSAKTVVTLPDNTNVGVQIGLNVTVSKSKENGQPEDGTEVSCQIGMNLTIVGSKETPDNGELTGVTAKGAARAAAPKTTAAKKVKPAPAPVAQAPAETAKPAPVVAPTINPSFVW